MKILSQSGARHFCQSFAASNETKSVEVGKYLDRFKNGRVLKEGSREFDLLRDALLRDAERFAFLAASNFACALRSLHASSAAWTAVALYYASFFSARSILAMNGGWIDGDRRWLDVTNLAPGALEISYRKTRHAAVPGKHASHKAFWAIFYHACQALQPYAHAQHSYALAPVQSSTTWLIDKRNSFNYESTTATSLVESFLARFNPAEVSSSLPGDLKVFRNVAGSLLALVHQFRMDYGLVSDFEIAGQPNLDAVLSNITRAKRPPEIDAYADALIAAFAA